MQQRAGCVQKLSAAQIQNAMKHCIFKVVLKVEKHIVKHVNGQSFFCQALSISLSLKLYLSLRDRAEL